MKREYRVVRLGTEPYNNDQENYALFQCAVDDNGKVLGRIISEPFLRGKTIDDLVTVLASAIRALDLPVVDEGAFDGSDPVFLYMEPVTETAAVGSESLSEYND
jgi:hypothetical protein